MYSVGGPFLSWGRMKNEIVGAIFPILPEHVQKLFDRNRDVFVKFNRLTKMRSGSMIVFYVSREKLLVGEGKIENIEKLNPEVVWSRYKDRIFLGKEEYDSYIKISPISGEKRKMRELTVFTLNKVKKYRNPFRSIYPVTSSGRYLTKEMVDEIRALSVS